jgi:hypothetical protein
MGPDEEDNPRRAVVDVDVAIAIDQLRGSVDAVADELQQLETTGRVVQEMGHMINDLQSKLQNVSVLLTLILLCVAGILAKLMNWL